MIDIVGDLLALKQQRERDYISIPDFIEDIKKKGSANFYYEVANWLLAKLYNNNPSNFDFRISLDYDNWAYENEIDVYTLPDSLYEEPEKCSDNIFFQILYQLAPREDHTIFETVTDILGVDFSNYYLNRNQIYRYLNIADEDKDNGSIEKNQIQEKTLTLAMALTKTDEFVKNTDINKSPVGTAERVVFEETIKDKNERIADLEKQLADTKKQLADIQSHPIKQSAVDCGRFSIYGHTSEPLEIIFDLCKQISEKCDPDNPHSYPSKADIEKYLKQYYTDSKKLSESIYQVVTSDRVKSKGKKPEDVETFQGFSK
ncbi:hypothetical protein [Lonepinella sp. BR2474]|uniref:hypothetical protein n=1 Tax=Lonepinella sp. BR2474 TaxID=3434548 RepID=UPI003F6DF2DA